MATLPEEPDYAVGVYQIETSDPVLGGPGGIANRQAQELAGRTGWLKERADGLLNGTLNAGQAAKALKLSTARTLSFSGAITGSGAFDGGANLNISTVLANSGVAAGTYKKVTVNAKGVITGGADLAFGDLPDIAFANIKNKPTTLGGYGITDAISSSSPVLTGDPQTPTAPQFDNNQSIANTEFVQRALGSFRSARTVSASAQLSLLDVGTVILYNGPLGQTLQLPPFAEVPEGAGVVFMNGSAAGDFSIAATGYQIDDGYIWRPSYPIARATFLYVVKLGLYWRCFGTATLGVGSSVKNMMSMPKDTTVEAIEKAWRDSRLELSDPLVTRHRDQIDTGVSTVLSAQQYSELQSYRQALRDWPETIGFPEQDSRPEPPTWLTELSNQDPDLSVLER